MSQIVDPQLAEECIAEYTKTYTSNDPELITRAYTESISFPFAGIIEFMNAAASVADTLEIKFGVYTQAFADKYGVTAGRLTVFLYTKGKGYGDPPKDVYNVGTSQP